MINQLSYVTKKLQHQDINETNENRPKVSSEEQDSGTESDDEQTREETEIASEMSSEISSGCSVRSRPSSETSTDTLTCEDLPAVGGAETHPEMPHSTLRTSTPHHPPRRVKTSRISSTSQSHQYLLRTPDSNSRESPKLAGQSHPCSGTPVRDLDRSSVDLDPTSVDIEGSSIDLDSDLAPCESLPLDPYFESVEHHSSEDELGTLTGAWDSRGDSGPPEKRKWSQVARLSLTDSGSSDDEVCVLTKGTIPPVEFRTSPPLEVHKPLRTISPPSKMLTLSSSNQGQQQPPHQRVSEGPLQPLGSSVLSDRAPSGAEGVTSTNCVHMNGRSESAAARAASPRKRHRHTPRPHRPCLDFEKMQQMKNHAVTQWRNGGELSLSFL